LVPLAASGPLLRHTPEHLCNGQQPANSPACPPAARRTPRIHAGAPGARRAARATCGVGGQTAARLPTPRRSGAAFDRAEITRPLLRRARQRPDRCRAAQRGCHL